MRAAILGKRGVITNIIEVASLGDVRRAKFLSGHSALAIGDTYNKARAEMGETPPRQLAPVVIDYVSGQLDGYISNDNEYTVPQQSAGVVATGKLAVSNRKFKVPFKRIDTGRVQLMPAEVVDRKFTIPLKFETNGIWVINQTLINSDYLEPLFSMAEYRFSVI